MGKLNNTQVLTLKDVSADVFIRDFAQHLKRQGKLMLPPWADIVKTGKHKELAPDNPDWLYIRSNLGVGALRRAYGGKYRRGTRTNVHAKASGKIIRYLLQQLEAEPLRYIETEEGAGRRLTKDGQREVDQVCSQGALRDD